MVRFFRVKCVCANIVVAAIGTGPWKVGRKNFQPGIPVALNWAGKSLTTPDRIHKNCRGGYLGWFPCFCLGGCQQVSICDSRKEEKIDARN